MTETTTTTTPSVEDATTAQRVADVIAAELASAKLKFPPMNSAHEGWAVILEEYEETAEILDMLGSRIQGMWGDVRHNDRNGARTTASDLADLAWSAAVEAIQTAAMALRFIEDLPEAAS